MLGTSGEVNGGATSSVGEYGATHGPMTAIATMPAKIATPILVRPMRQASLRIIAHSERRFSPPTTAGSTSSESVTLISGVLIADLSLVVG